MTQDIRDLEYAINNCKLEEVSKFLAEMGKINKNDEPFYHQYCHIPRSAIGSKNCPDSVANALIDRVDSDDCADIHADHQYSGPLLRACPETRTRYNTRNVKVR